MSFSVSYDRTAKIASAFTIFTLIAIATVTRSVVAGCLAMLVIGISYGCSPQSYEVSGGVLTVKRLISDIPIPLDDVRAARIAAPRDLKWAVRLWGSGGLFGYYGFYRTAELGMCKWYVTDRSKCVVLITRKKTVVLSPDDREGLLAAIPAPDYTQK